jgi:hypothetical protein
MNMAIKRFFMTRSLFGGMRHWPGGCTKDTAQIIVIAGAL